jgi:hypothetical protein
MNTMEKFLLLIREDLIQRENLSQEEHYACIQTMTRWVESLAESINFEGGKPLLNNGRYVGRDYILSDGPFIEAKESISGFIQILAENLEQAAAIAQTCPLVVQNAAAIEVRPIMSVPHEYLP